MSRHSKSTFRPSFYKVLPEITNEEAKAMKILELYMQSGKSYNKLARELDLSPKTAKSLMDDLTNQPVFNKYVKGVIDHVKDFADPTLLPSLYVRFEKELKELDKRIHRKGADGKDEHVVKLLRLKHDLLKKMLDVNTNFLVRKQDKNASTAASEVDQVDAQIEKLKNAAVASVGDKVQ